MNVLGRFKPLETCVFPSWELGNGRGSMVIAAWMAGFALWVTRCIVHLILEDELSPF